METRQAPIQFKGIGAEMVTPVVAVFGSPEVVVELVELVEMQLQVAVVRVGMAQQAISLVATSPMQAEVQVPIMEIKVSVGLLALVAVAQLQALVLTI
jgi:hypothetical protein